MKRLAFLAFVACLWGCALSCTGRAEPIIYTEQFTASGTLGSKSFMDAQVTLTFTGDTANVGGGPLFFTNSLGTATVTVAGTGTATIKNGEVFDSHATLDAGFGGSGGLIVETNDSLFGTYKLTTSIDPPESGGAFAPLGVGTDTDQGTLKFTTVSSTSTFGATLGGPATPEPASLTLLGIGAGGLLGYAWRKRKRAAS
jgi:hypothetical protein